MPPTTSRKGQGENGDSDAVQQTRATKAVKEFGSMNTQSQRNALKEGDFYLLEDIMPIGKGNLTSVPGPGDSIFTIPGAGVSIEHYYGVNLSGVPYFVVFGDDGSCYLVDINGVVQTLSVPGAVAFSHPDVTIWQGVTLLVLDPVAGYYGWPVVPIAPAVAIDGSGNVTKGKHSWIVTFFFGPSAPVAAVGAAGNVNAGRHKWAVTFSTGITESSLGLRSNQLNISGLKQVNLTAVPLGPAGTVARNIYRTVSGDTGPYKLVGSVDDNTTTTFTDNIADAGLGQDAPAATAESAPGTASVQLTLTSAKKVNTTAIPIGPPGTASRNVYRTVAGDTGTYKLVASILDNTTTILDDSVADASLGADAPTEQSTLFPLDTTKKGNTIATFAGRSWLGNKRGITFTAPASYWDFTTANGGGNVLMTDSAFIGNITKLLSSLDVLWVFGESAINQISNVQFDTTTTFSNVNVSSSVGSPFQFSVNSFLRQILFVTGYGAYREIGVTPQRISEAIDGTFKLLDLTVIHDITGAIFTLNNILCWGFLIRYNDPDTGTQRPIILVFFDDKWFLASQGGGLTHIASVESGGFWNLYGCNSTDVFPLFTKAGYSVHKFKTPLFDMPDDTVGKDMVRAQITLAGATGIINATLTPQTEKGNQVIKDSTKQASNLLQFENLVFQDLSFFSNEISFLRWMTGNKGKMVGFDLSLDSDPFTITSYAFEHIETDSW